MNFYVYAQLPSTLDISWILKDAIKNHVGECARVKISHDPVTLKKLCEEQEKVAIKAVKTVQ